MVSRGLQQRVEIKRSKVCQRIHFKVAPDVFNGIKFGCVGREEMGMQTRVFHKELARSLRAMGLKTIPDQSDRPGKLLQKHAEEMDDPIGVYICVGVKSEIQVDIIPRRGYAKCCDHRYFLMRSRALIEQRRLAPRAPRAANQRRHQYAAFVNKNEPGLQARGFFLMRGHSVLTQPRIKSSSRSAARRAGFWGLHPNEWSNRPIWST